MEYELYNQLFNKLKVTGMNVLFGLNIQFSIGDKLMVALAVSNVLMFICCFRNEDWGSWHFSL